MDSAQAYESHANEFAKARDRSTIGSHVVGRWAQSLRAGSETLEIACGSGYPVTRELVNAGLKLWAIDSSPTLLQLFQSRFPDVQTQCAPVQESDFFDRMFDAVIAIGLLFLLSEQDQRSLLLRVANVLKPGGHFLFTAPVETGTWRDMTTGHECRSLGYDAYIQILKNSGFQIIGTVVDEGKNNHYEVVKTQ